MAEANKPEKLGFVRLYNTRLPLAAVEVQKPGALKGIGTMRHDISLVYVAHYCWEGGLLLVSQHIDDAPAGWLDREHTSPAMTSHVCATETAAVDRIVRMKGEAWENAHDRVEAAIGMCGPVSVTRYDADGVIQEDPKPNESEADIAAEYAQYGGKRPGMSKNEARLVKQLRADGAPDVQNISEDNDSASGFGDDLIDETTPEARGDVDGATGEELDAAESKFEDSRPLVYGKRTGKTRADAVAARKAELKGKARYNPIDQSTLKISVDAKSLKLTPETRQRISKFVEGVHRNAGVR